MFLMNDSTRRMLLTMIVLFRNSFGMYHDTEKTGCVHRSGPILHIMTPSFEADTVQVSWSSCSRRDITHFLE